MGGLIKREIIEQVYDQSDIVQVVRASIPELKKEGANFKAKSPWVNEKTPSFVVSPSKQIFKDFSTGKGGNAVKFVMEMQNVSFPEAITYLAEMFNIPVEYEDPEKAKFIAEKKAEKESLRSVLDQAHSWYQRALFDLPKTHPAWLEIKRRGYSENQVLEYGIAYAPGKDFLFERMKAKNILSQARKLALVGEYADKFADRLIYPVRNKYGLNCGFAGRRLDAEQRAKWINSAETELYHKSKILYGLDRAKQAIVKEQMSYLVEGYNDVIAFQENGLLNTVSGCGTALTKNQLLLLKRLSPNIALVFDGDKAGRAAALKAIPLSFELGLNPKVILLGDLDPDDFCREKANDFAESGLKDYLHQPEFMKDGFGFLMAEKLSSDDVHEKALAIRELCLVISKIQDSTLKSFYLDWLSSETKRKPSLLNKIIKELESAQEVKNDLRYEFPLELEGKLEENKEELIREIDKYKLFQAGNRIWLRRGSEPPYHFNAVSNFQIEIIQHMNDDKFPMKLMRMTNVEGKTKIFDVVSERIMTSDSFRKVVSNYGNYFYKANPGEHDLLLSFMFDKMGEGEKIEVLGWQNDGFWVFNNRVVRPDESDLEIDENGVFSVKNTEGFEVSYYVPSANKVYRNNPYKFDSQKKVRVKGDASLSFERYAAKMLQVHRGHAITGLLFSLASVFQDLIVKEAKGFPLVFLYGPPSTGKDQLIECCQGFFGEPQTAINLEGGASTAKAQLRELAQFANLISHLSEYQRGDKKLDGLLKGMWDRRGYKRGTLDSHVSTESIPVLSSVFLTGNDYPDQDALITRVIWEEMTKSDFSREEVQRYEELKDMLDKGISHLTVDIIKHRSNFATKFKKHYRETYASLSEFLSDTKAHSRIINNLSVLGTTYQILKDDLRFPFGWQDVLDQFRKIVENQMRKLNTASIGSKWWDCFLAVCRTRHEPLRNHVDFRIYNGRMYFNLTNTYNRIAQQWYKQYNEVAPGKGKVLDMLKEDELLALERHSSFRFGTGTDGAQTSAHSVSTEHLSISDLLAEMVQWQENERIDRLDHSPKPPDPDNDQMPF